MEPIFITQEQKDLLLKDLCARLPYGVKVQNIYNTETIGRLRSIDLDDYCYEIMFYTYEGKALTVCDRSKLFRFGKVLRYKPYLFPMSSMTEEQQKEYRKVCDLDMEILENRPMRGEPFPAMYNSQDWLDAHHFDYRGLIPMGLGIDATGLDIYTNSNE